MRFYIEQFHNGRWLSLASFPTNEAAGEFVLRMMKAGIPVRTMRVLAV